jgi:hypothetical protein
MSVSPAVLKPPVIFWIETTQTAHDARASPRGNGALLPV